VVPCRPATGAEKGIWVKSTVWNRSSRQRSGAMRVAQLSIRAGREPYQLAWKLPREKAT
jgi:hypothetical protein